MKHHHVFKANSFLISRLNSESTFVLWCESNMGHLFTILSVGNVFTLVCWLVGLLAGLDDCVEFKESWGESGERIKEKPIRFGCGSSNE